MARPSPRFYAGLAVFAALIVAVSWFLRRPTAPVSALDGTVMAIVTRHGAPPMRMPQKPVPIRDRARVRALVAALGVDGHPIVACPPDYADAEVGILLTGGDVYARRNVYLWGVSERSTARVVVVTSGGCRGGSPADADALARLLSSDVSSRLPDASGRAEGEPER